MRRLRAFLKRLVAYGLFYSGALWVYRFVALRNRAVVLTYHRVLPASADSYSSPGIIVSPSVFAAHMRFLRRHFKPLSAGEFQQCLDRGRFEIGACLVTFDDGWHDNELYALPILQELTVPAVLFVATEFIGTDTTFWQERISRQLHTLSSDSVIGRPTLAAIGVVEAFDSADEEKVRQDVRDFVDRLKLSTKAEIDRVVALASAACRQIDCADDPGDDRFLDWNALTRIASSGWVTIGSHAHSHTPLPRLGRVAATADLQLSVREIKRHGIPTPSTFAFPNGDFDAATLDCLTEAGIRIGFTTARGHIAPGADPRCLPRVNIHEGAASTSPEFLCRILGIF